MGNLVGDQGFLSDGPKNLAQDPSRMSGCCYQRGCWGGKQQRPRPQLNRCLLGRKTESSPASKENKSSNNNNNKMLFLIYREKITVSLLTIRFPLAEVFEAKLMESCKVSFVRWKEGGNSVQAKTAFVYELGWPGHSWAIMNSWLWSLSTTERRIR